MVQPGWEWGLRPTLHPAAALPPAAAAHPFRACPHLPPAAAPPLQVVNNIPSYDLLVAMGSGCGHALIDDTGCIRAPFYSLFRPDAPGFRVAHFAE